MLNEEKLDLVVSQLVENIESRITFYSDEDREFFLENVVNIILLSEQDQVEYNLYCFLEHNYSNYSSLQHNLNEGIGSFVKGIAKGIGRAIGFGKPAEKIAFGAPPTTAIAGKDGKDGRGGEGGTGGGNGEGSGTNPAGIPGGLHQHFHLSNSQMQQQGQAQGSGSGVPNVNLGHMQQQTVQGSPGARVAQTGKGDIDQSKDKTTFHGDVVGGDKVGGDKMSGNAAKAGRDLTQQKLSGNAQAQAGNVEDNRKQSVSSTAGDSNTTTTIAQPNTQGQKAAAQARTRQSMSKAAFIERHGEEEGLKRHAAHREVRRGQAAKQRASARAAAANQGTQTTKQTATADTKGAAGGDSKVGNVDFGSGPRGHTMGDGGRSTASTTTPPSTPAKQEKKTNRSKSGRSSGSAPATEEPSKVNDSVDMSVLYADYMNRFLKG